MSSEQATGELSYSDRVALLREVRTSFDNLKQLAVAGEVGLKSMADTMRPLLEFEADYPIVAELRLAIQDQASSRSKLLTAIDDGLVMLRQIEEEHGIGE